MERRDSGGTIFVRWTNPDNAGVEKRNRKNLGIVVRDPRTGRLEAKRVRAAEITVQQLQARLLVGHSHAQVDGDVRPNAPSARRSTPGAVALSLRAGFDLALDPERGKYGSTRTRRYEQMANYRARLFGGPRNAAPLLNPRLTWSAFVPGRRPGHKSLPRCAL
jgi:hypothetical protein